MYVLPHAGAWLAPVLRPWLDAGAALNALRFGIAFALLLIPSTAMGATLPLLVAALFERDGNVGRVLGRLYGWNTLGAVVGALAGDALLIAALGIRGSAWVAALANLAAAVGAFAVAGRLDAPARPATTEAAPLPLGGRARALLVAAALCGATLLALEVVWFRFLTLFVLADSLAFALLLAVVLAGIGGGGLLGGRILAGRPDADRALPFLALLSGALCVATYAGFELPLRGIGKPAVHAWRDVVALGVPLMFPCALASGVLFTWLGHALEREAPAATRSAGLLAFANTAGAMLGSLAAGFWMLPRLGIETSIPLLAGLYGVAARSMLAGGARPRRPATAAALAAAGLALAAGIGVATPGLMRARYLQVPIDHFAERDHVEPVAVREGLTETAIYLRRRIYGETQYHRLVTNAHSMAGDAAPARRYMKLFVYWPVAVHPDPKSALLISYGVGSTGKALTDTRRLERIDIVDPSRDILELNAIAFPDPADRPLEDPRVRVHVEDGRWFLQTSDHRWDVITGEPPPPKAAGIVSLFTREFFALAHARLADGGIFSYWLPVHSLEERETKAIVRAFCDVFPDCALWAGSMLDWILTGTRGAAGPVSLAQFARQWTDARVGPEIRGLGFETPEQLGALFLAGSDDLRAIAGDTPPLVDDFPKRLGREPMAVIRTRRIYRPWMDETRARQRFERSEVVARLWPEPLRTRTLPWFEVQGVVNAFELGPPADAVARMRTVHGLLARPALRTLVLWHLGADADTQRAADRALARGHRSAPLHFELAARALAARRFERAAELFGRAYAEAPERRELLYWRLYALCRSGALDEARVLAVSAGLTASRRPLDGETVRFLEAEFGLLTGADGRDLP